MSKAFSIQIVCEFPLLLQGISSVLEKEADFSIVAQTDHADDALPDFRKHYPEVCIVDLMPCMGGIFVLKQLLSEKKPPAVLAVSCQRDPAIAHRIMQEGALGFISQRAHPQALVRAVRAMACGKPFIEQAIAEGIVLQSLKGKGDAGPLSGLTPQETKVCLLLMDGLNQNQIADRMYLSPKTVANYHTSILGKLYIENDQQLMRIGIRAGLISV